MIFTLTSGVEPLYAAPKAIDVAMSPIRGRLSSVTILRTRESEMRAVNEFILSVGPRREVSAYPGRLKIAVPVDGEYSRAASGTLVDEPRNL